MLLFLFSCNFFYRTDDFNTDGDGSREHNSVHNMEKGSLIGLAEVHDHKSRNSEKEESIPPAEDREKAFI